MPSMPNPFNSGGPVCTPDDAAASVAPKALAGAAADIQSEAEYDSLMDCIGEIFAGARKLFDPDPAAWTNADEVTYDLLRQMDDPHAADLIHVPAGLEAEFDPPPLFLQIAV